MEEAHSRAQLDPEKYRQWVGRDYRAMGVERAKLGGIALKRYAEAQRQAGYDNRKRTSKNKGKGW